MPRLSLLLPLLLLSVYTISAQAGPDWRAIENARETKQQEKQEVKEETIRQQTALEKLEAACAKAKGNKELEAICTEIITAYKAL